MKRAANSREQKLISKTIARLRAGVLAIVCGLLTGALLLMATIWLIIRGGENVGQHLDLLSNYLPGYSVTWPGAVLGFLYGVLLGGAAGWMAAWIYNRIVALRHPG